ncbi:MAG: PIN domain-containing protein [Acidobacteria bacterium]|nr:MAG: PIN domain-containing protein [Acidobacteriota bacterium]
MRVGLSFVDTNVLIYSISEHPTEKGKRDRAQQILAECELVLSVQVLQEFYSQATRSSRPGCLSHQLALGFIRDWRRYPTVPLSVAVFDRALELCARYKLSYRDSAIVAAAAMAGCHEVLTEDMQHGATIAGVTIRNPFL